MPQAIKDTLQLPASTQAATQPSASLPAATTTSAAPASKPQAAKVKALKTEAPKIEAADTAATDSLVGTSPAQMHIIMDAPRPEQARGEELDAYGFGTSWIVLGLLALFVLIAVRFRRNMRYTGSLLRELVQTPEQGKLFDDTMRETTFIGLLNLLCIVSSGVLLWQCVGEWEYPSILSLRDRPGLLGWCLLLSGGLYMSQRIAYYCIANIFRNHTVGRRWLRAFSSSQSVLALVLLPLVLLGFFYPGLLSYMLIPSVGAWILLKSMFVVRGISIFFSRGGSILGFLYYLCSVEIVPVMLVYSTAVAICHS